ncbi:MAG: ATP-binding cassette domain-containing protein [Candidatus Riflebacteria bacterium]|nr:ATP-binding cassette domain-containing protein [Candidatus Riflebacteria bacterium]
METSFKLKEVSFSCKKGTINGIVGGNGSGKSTIARLIAGLITPQSGEITVDGFKPNTHSGNCQFLAGIIFQTPDTQIVGTTVAEDLAFGLENLGIAHEEMLVRVEETAKQFGLAHLLDTPVHFLSGGQKQMLCIASVMVMRPAWIIFDEPTSHLDPWARSVFWNIVSGFAHEQNIGILVISQLPEDILHFENIFCFENGGLVFSGQVDELKKESSQLNWLNRPEAWKLEEILEACR